jgi:hypothetical protein
MFGWKIKILVVGLKGLDAKTNWSAVNRQSQSNSDFDFWFWLDQLRVADVRREKLVAEVEESSGNPEEGATSAVGSRYQGMSSKDWEDFMCAVVPVVFGVCNSDCRSYL